MGFIAVSPSALLINCKWCWNSHYPQPEKKIQNKKNQRKWEEGDEKETRGKNTAINDIGGSWTDGRFRSQSGVQHPEIPEDEIRGWCQKLYRKFWIKRFFITTKLYWIHISNYARGCILMDGNGGGGNGDGWKERRGKSGGRVDVSMRHRWHRWWTRVDFASVSFLFPIRVGGIQNCFFITRRQWGEKGPALHHPWNGDNNFASACSFAHLKLQSYRWIDRKWIQTWFNRWITRIMK